MRTIMKHERTPPLRAALTALALTFAIAPLAPALAEDDCPKGDLPVAGTVEGRATTVGFIVSARWGEGTLTLNDGTEHKFTGEGVKLIETGAAEVTFKGKVYNLAKLEDFEGDYGAVSGGLRERRAPPERPGARRHPDQAGGLVRSLARS
jgi:hypothetical protein